MIEFQPEDADLDSRPKQVHLSYSYSDVDLPIDVNIVRRIRTDFDPFFVPVIKREVYKYASGGTQTFVHFGFGVGHSPGLPVLDPAVYTALKPFTGYLSKIERATVVSLWAQGRPFAPVTPEDGTPGETVPFDERVYAYARECDSEMRRLAAQAPSGDSKENSIPGISDELRQLSYRAVTRARNAQKEAKTKRLDEASNHLREVIKEEKKYHQSFLDMTDDERMAMAVLQGDPNPTNAVRFGPAKPGGIVVVSR